MKVREALERLSSLDPDLELICYSADEEMATPKHRFRIFEIDDISTIEAERKKGKDQIPSLNFERTAALERLAVIEITSTF